MDLDLSQLTKNSNLCTSNSSFLFIYIETAATFLTLSFNRLCKSSTSSSAPSSSISTSIQRLSVNISPVGTFKKCSINSKGTHILVVYDKCLFVVELPVRWGKYDQYNGGSATAMCKSIRLPHTTDIVDAVWHPGNDSTRLICLTKDNFLRILNYENFKTPVKEYHLQSIFGDDLHSKKPLKGINIDVGGRMMFAGKEAFPIYVLKTNGRIECLIDYEL